MAVSLHRQGRLTEAERGYRAILQVIPHHFGCLNHLGMICGQQGRPQEAESLFRNAVAVDPRSAQAHNHLGIALAELGRSEDAIAEYEKAIGLEPANVEALNNLGLLLLLLRRPQEALPHLEKALALRPQSAEVHCNLATVLGRLNRHEAALAHYQKALPITANAAETHNDLANVLAVLDRHAEAVEHYRKALAIRPEFAEAHNNLGNALAALERHEEAIPHFKAALAMKPNFAEAMTNLGQTLAALDNAEEALTWYQKALAALPDLAEAHNGLGNVLQTLGRLAQSRDEYETAIKLAPRNAGYQRSLALAKRFTAADPQLAAMEELARDVALLSENEQIALHFSLGKAYADLDRHEQAFRHYLEGNALKRRQTRYDEAATLARFDRIKAVFTPQLMQQKQGLGDPSDVSVFIVGMPRSGTTLIEQVLASHPKVFGAGELREMAGLLAEIDSNRGGPSTFPEVVPLLGAEELRRLGARHGSRIRALALFVERITDKQPGNFPFAGFIHLVLPRARIIHARRDPVDTCLSCFTQLFSKRSLEWCYDLSELGRFYRAYAALMDHWRRVLPEEVMLEVQYEDMVADFEPQARRLVAFCGLPWDDRCLAFHETERPVRTASAVQVRQPIYRSAVGRWRAYGDLLRPLLEELGGA